MGFWAWYELGIQFNVFPYGYQIFPKHLLKTALLWHLFHKSNAYICVNLVLHFLFCFTDLFVYSYANYYSKFSSVAQLCLTLHDPLDCSTPGFPVHCQLLEFTQTHVHWVGNGDLGSIPGLGRSPGGGHSNPCQYSCLENPHRQRSLVGSSPWGLKEDMTEELSTAQIKHCTL